MPVQQEHATRLQTGKMKDIQDASIVSSGEQVAMFESLDTSRSSPDPESRKPRPRLRLICRQSRDQASSRRRSAPTQEAAQRDTATSESAASGPRSDTSKHANTRGSSTPSHKRVRFNPAQEEQHTPELTYRSSDYFCRESPHYQPGRWTCRGEPLDTSGQTNDWRKFWGRGCHENSQANIVGQEEDEMIDTLRRVLKRLDKSG